MAKTLTHFQARENAPPTSAPRPAEPDTDEWVRRGEMVATPLAVLPGARSERWERWARAQRHDWEWRRLARYLPARPSLAVDLGCGYGDWTARLTTIARQLIAVDMAPGFVAETTRRLRTSGHTDWTVSCGDVRRFVDYANADLVVLGGILTYLDDVEATELLTRVRERLSPDGIVQQRDWCAVNLGRAHHHWAHGQFRAHRRAADYHVLAQRAGLVVIEERHSSSLHAEQLVHRTLGMRHEGATGVMAPLARAVGRVATAWARRATVAFFLRRA